MTKPAPAQQQPISISFSNEELSGWSDLPPGVYRVPDSQTIISGHQKGGIAGILFGPLGVLAQSAMNSSHGGSATKDVQETLKINLTSDAQAIARTLTASGRFKDKFTSNENAELPRLSVSTAVALTFVDDTNVRPYVVLKASLYAAHATESQWATRYMASNGAPRPLVGPNSWTANEGEELKKAIVGNLESAIDFMLKDVSSPYERDANHLVLIQGSFPYVRKRLQLVGYQLAEDERSLVFVPRLGDVLVFAGVNIMDKSVTIHRPAKEGDLPFTTVDDSGK